MIFYNQVTEITLMQFGILALCEIFAIAGTVIAHKVQISKKQVVVSMIIALILSFGSIVIVQGTYGGMAYHERFGWPLQYHTVSRSIADKNIAMPYQIHFDWLRFIANAFLWSAIPMLLLSSRSQTNAPNHKRAVAVVSLLFLALLTGYFSYRNHSVNKLMMITQTSSSVTHDNSVLISQKQIAIETASPEFKNFESQQSFAGQEVRISNKDSTHFFVYIVNGSGVPIVHATCFKVDDQLHVVKVGEFPNRQDRTILYTNIDPVTCNGL